jgi:hypothetical protein
VFGPVVLLGLGGTTAEALADVSVRLAPLPETEAGAMAGDLAGRALLDGDTWTARARSAQGHEIPARKVNLHAIR